MGLSFEHSILPMSDLRANLEKIKKQLTKTPIIITNKGRPDFGICDLDTLAIAVQIKDLDVAGVVSSHIPNRHYHKPSVFTKRS